MDSGIESTESSNGSISDTCNNITDAQNEEQQNNSMNLEEKSVNNSNDYQFIEPSVINMSNIRSKKSSKTDKDIRIVNLYKLGTSRKVVNSPNCLKLICEKELNNKSGMEMAGNEKEDSRKNDDLDSEMKDYGGVEDATPVPRISLSNFSQDPLPNLSNLPKPQMKNPEISLPEGCCLKLNFPRIDTEIPTIHEQATPFETFSPVAFANGPLQINCNSEPYTGSLAVLPYESRELQRKFRHYRRRLRQIISTKPKEKKLRMAAGLNNVELVERLLKEGVDPKATDEKERTALHIAASKGYTKIVKLLLQHGADPNQKDSVGNTALHLAACTSHIETVTPLLKAGTDVKQADNQGYSPLHLANSRLKLLQRDPNPSAQNLRTQVYEIVEMMQEYLKSSGNKEEAELLTALTNQLSLSDANCSGEEDIKQLLSSLQDLTLSKTKKN